MKNLRKSGAALVLTCALGFSALAGETSTPPCAEPVPGETSTPPCAAAPSDVDTPSSQSTTPGDMGTPSVTSNETSFTDIAADVLLNCLSLF